MKTLAELHKEHIQWKSELEFYVQEIEFLEHIISSFLSKPHATSDVNTILEYEKEFTHVQDRMQKLLVNVRYLEEKIARKMQEDEEYAKKELLDEQYSHIEHIETLERAARTLKESLYSFVNDTKRKEASNTNE
jgi:seryl-tRNA synthetase